MLSRWPGSVHDMRVFKDAMTTHHHKFPHPPPGSLLDLSSSNFGPITLVHVCLIEYAGKYYVVDAGYPNRLCYNIDVQGTMSSNGIMVRRHKV